MEIEILQSSRFRVRVLFFFTALLLSACHSVTSPFVEGVVGASGQHVAIKRDTHGNEYGYYQYLPKDYNENNKHPIVIYWNGANTITGDGVDDLKGLLKQGLPQLIQEGQHFPAIIISAQLPNWKKDDITPFVHYILRKYRKVIDKQRVYMTGFSAGGGITCRFARDNVDILAAIVPIAAALHPLKNPKSLEPLSKIPTWFFHNERDEVVSIKPVKQWHEALKQSASHHKITIYPVAGHYAWRETYQSKALWEWLLSQKSNHSSGER